MLADTLPFQMLPHEIGGLSNTEKKLVHSM
jgi:hypothetical protein